MPTRNTVSSMLPLPYYIVQWQATPVPRDNPLFKIRTEKFYKLDDAKKLVKSLVSRLRDNVSLYKFVPKQNPDGMLSFDIVTVWHDFWEIVQPLETVSDGKQTQDN